MTTLFHTWLYGTIKEIQSNIRRKELYRTNQVSNFLGGSFSNRDNLRAQSNLEEKPNPSISKDVFSSTYPSIFTSILLIFKQNLQSNYGEKHVVGFIFCVCLLQSYNEINTFFLIFLLSFSKTTFFREQLSLFFFWLLYA